ncbi:homing endonuclease associated repeat-containing protein [Haloplanus ruber]|uniref:Homing endonuclease associated repeat-containing protein n=1 Tax=Haloplanus ruber TaxID=869892 RepID=A0ABD6D1I4_9EURY|nr:helix-hairpin-helix domain-containing protein [Haloplanus ruber]
MESPNTPPDEKPDPDTLLSQAKGSIDLQMFTGERSGLFSKAYLADSSVYERLDDHETIHFLLVSRSNGVAITSKESNQSHRLSPSGSYRALVAITNRRIFFLIGDDEGDTFLEVDINDISGVELQSGFLTTTITFETSSKQYEFGVKKRESSDPGGAVEYVREQFVPVTNDKGTDPSEETRSGQPLSPPPDTNGRQSESTEATASRMSSASGDDSSGDEPQSGPEAVFVRDSEQLAEDIRETARHAAWTIDDVDTSEDAPTDAIPRLETAKEELRRIADEPGIRASQVENAIDRLDRALSELDQGDTDPEEKTSTDQFSSSAADADDSQSESSKRTVSETRPENTSDSGADEPQSGPETVFVGDSEQLSENTRKTTRHAAWTINDVDTGEDDLADATSRLETAKEELQCIADEPGIRTSQVEDVVTRVNGKLSKLKQITTAYAEAKRYLSLADNGMHIPQETLDDVQSSIDNALTAANELERSTARLKEYQAEISTASDSERPQRRNYQYQTDNSSSETQRERSDGARSSFPENEPEKTQKKSPSPSRSELISDLQRIRNRLEKAPDPVHVRKFSNYSESAFEHEFGTYEEAIAIAFDDVKKEATRERGTEQDAGTSGTNSETPEDSSSPDVSDPTREDVLAELERVSEELGKRPSTSDYHKHSTYSTSDVYQFFDSWDSAIDAASIETISRQELLEDLRRVREECGFVPLTIQIDKHGEFSQYEYQREFGSIDDALREAGLDLKQSVIDYVQQAKDSADGRPNMSYFASVAPYSSGVIYKFFESWDDALAAANSAGDDTKSDPGTTTEPPTIGQNELSERYEVLRNLRSLCQSVINMHDESSDETTSRQRDPMEKWLDAIEKRWSGESIEVDNYGAQQKDRNPFSMREYRQEFGNGDRVTEFSCISTCPPIPTLQTFLGRFLIADLDTFYLPVDAKTNATFPVIVETEDELERAIGMLERLPLEPPAAGDDQEDESEDNGDDEEDDQESTTNPPSDDLLDVGGVTEQISTTLQQEGFESRDDLRSASVDQLTSLDGISDQIAMRIKLDVGE